MKESFEERKFFYLLEKAKILKKYFKGKNMLEENNDFLAVANYCCKSMRYIAEIKNRRNIKFLWKQMRPDWQAKGVDISRERFGKLMKDVYCLKGEALTSYRNEYNLDSGLRVMILDHIVSKACRTDEYYRYVVCIMKAENELRLIRIFEGMADHYNNLKKASYKGGEDV